MTPAGGGKWDLSVPRTVSRVAMTLCLDPQSWGLEAPGPAALTSPTPGVWAEAGPVRRSGSPPLGDHPERAGASQRSPGRCAGGVGAQWPLVLLTV